MASQFFDFVIKIRLSPTAPLTRSNIYLIEGPFGQWQVPRLIFPFQRNMRLKRVTAQISPLAINSSNNSFAANPSGVAVELNPTWYLYGDFLNLDQSVLANPSPIPIGPDLINYFTIENSRLYLTDSQTEYRPDCLYCGGFRVSEVGINFGGTYTLSSAYFGRIRMQFEFDL